MIGFNFNHPMPRLPESLTHLAIKSIRFDHRLPQLPPNLKYLILGKGFGGPVILPSKLNSVSYMTSENYNGRDFPLIDHPYRRIKRSIRQIEHLWLV